MLKRKDFVRLLKRNGWYLKRNGASHDIYTDGKNIEAVSRQRELKESVVMSIIQRRNLK